MLCRHALESLFASVINIYKNDKTSLIAKAIDMEDSIDSKAKIKINLMSMFPVMKQINALIKRPNVHDAVWTTFEFNKDCPLPDFGSNLLHGGLSDLVHNREMGAIVVSDECLPGYHCFFQQVAGFQDREIKIFEKKLVASYKSK